MAKPRRIAQKPTATERNFNFKMRSPLLDAFLEYAQSLKPRPTTTGHIELAMMEYLERRGRWPRKDAKAG